MYVYIYIYTHTNTVCVIVRILIFVGMCICYVYAYVYAQGLVGIRMCTYVCIRTLQHGVYNDVYFPHTCLPTRVRPHLMQRMLDTETLAHRVDASRADLFHHRRPGCSSEIPKRRDPAKHRSGPRRGLHELNPMLHDCVIWHTIALVNLGFRTPRRRNLQDDSEKHVAASPLRRKASSPGCRKYAVQECSGHSSQPRQLSRRVPRCEAAPSPLSDSTTISTSCRSRI